MTGDGERLKDKATEFARSFKTWVDEEALDAWDGGPIGYALGGLYEMADEVLTAAEATPR